VCKSKPNLFELLTSCIESATDNGRLSAYELLGYCAKHAFPQLQPFIGVIMPILIQQLNINGVIDQNNEDGISVVYNACWSTSEICIQSGEGMAPYSKVLLQSLLDINRNPNTPEFVNENAAIAVGRLGLENSHIIAPHISEFAGKFLELMKSIDYSEEKASALTGFTFTVGRNHLAIENNLLEFFSIIAQYNQENENEENKEKSLYKQGLKVLFEQVAYSFR
jgi:transportin-1